MNNCKTCKHWKKFTNNYDIKYRGPNAGNCYNLEKFVYTDDFIQSDTLAYYDRESVGAEFFTGENFGCIHWSPANEQ